MKRVLIALMLVLMTITGAAAIQSAACNTCSGSGACHACEGSGAAPIGGVCYICDGSKACQVCSGSGSF